MPVPILYSESSRKGTLSGREMVSLTRAGRLREINAKIQSLYGSREKRGFVKMSVSRAARLMRVSTAYIFPLFAHLSGTDCIICRTCILK